MQIKEILNHYNKLDKIKNKKLPVRVAFIIARNLKILSDIVATYEDSRLSLIDKYAKRDENNEIIIDENENAQVEDTSAFLKELNDLLTIEYDVDIKSVDLKDVEACDEEQYDSLTPEDIGALEFMLKAEDDE